MPKQKINNIKNNLFTDNINEYTCYILGLLWADGSMCGNMISLESVKEDIESLRKVFLDTGEWNIRYRNREDWKPQMVYHISNKEFSMFLKNNDYDKKSYASADKILQKIPDNLKNYWLRGYWDGDGCFYFNNISKAVQCTATSTYEQDWTFLENIYKNLNIKYSIRRVKKQKSSYSQIRITNQKDSLKLINYLYAFEDDLGFKRKKEKASLILNTLKDF
jgi:hypothetical protein